MSDKILNNVHIDFVEYDLNNGLHVILHQDNTSSLVTISMMYHVGSKNEDPNKTGFAHFFEHLMFEGSENIPRGKFFNYVQDSGGSLNANTTQDRTFYYEVFSAHHLETGLWLESERMLHALVDHEGIETQRSVVKEERRQRYDNQPYGTIVEQCMKRAYKLHPYQWSVIGSMDHIDNANEDDFQDFYERYYVPQNAVLCLAGNFEMEHARLLIDKYFSTIPRGKSDIKRPTIAEKPLSGEVRDVVYDNVQLPAVVHMYRIPGFADKDYYAVQLFSELMSNGSSSKLYQSLVDKSQVAIQVGSFPFELEHPGVVIQFAIGNPDSSVETLETMMDEEINKIIQNGLTSKELEKLINQTETRLVNEKSSLLSIAEGLSTYYTYFKDTNMYNKELEQYTAVSIADIQNIAQKYFQPNNRVSLFWLPKDQESNI
ncbi:MAG TPA: pitrilysin family protein [Saprospiraceae bacterium]|jgi:zinc protease|nr:insulinase family protein [Saprospiraceae bacterium]HQU95507.1 pitrilysin family protein [Saprospiraceae bacterium]HQW96962.1 pitrilysin family protein [Saprospiraceae bacterium]